MPDLFHKRKSLIIKQYALLHSLHVLDELALTRITIHCTALVYMQL